MSGLEELPESVHRMLLFAVVLYFGLVIYGGVAGNPLALFASQVLFGLIAIGLGGLLVRQADGERSPILAAGVSLAIGGAAQLAWFVFPNRILNDIASIGVIVGIVLYVYAVWVAD
ncbi:hypothetical protein [Natronobeatus ordinarius]|uniref:hypothetical protein n=1 Tax=Natronobeatus ordinarius TaxID=2963433 RepID=UPI0020CD89B7|nr:hypothetical protein [Natronobeatus ordinarius]